MKKRTLFTLSAIALSLSLNVHAAPNNDEAKTNEVIGFGSGAAAGALIAGPLGAMIGGIFGVLIADDVNDENALQASTDKLAKANLALDQKQEQLLVLQKEYQKAQQQNQIQLVAMDSQIERVMQEMESNIQFRTASYVVEEHFKTQLDLVADGLKNNPELTVTLSGFADSRGDDSYNQALSQQRVISVKDYLVSKGVNGKQVLTHSFGESQPVSAQTNNEDHFFDRRVLVRVEQGQQSMTASN
ncbi:sortase-associated OmpA-like protein PdsO [Aliiglaciecola sp. M165]|uniref:sortase-associated OmpA-like protein PdsO n=1 Tax=Aliiglaciecola sp. M165 TaxID=2593649 RepID=UPI00117FDBB2|nr:sortase-associated OmpA-like protein PdsO [Aliiglaciecola sp. M165]TRY33105.1 sortase-associated OmpA-like protein PdsO [Aliiglaciecola sp. M165]